MNYEEQFLNHNCFKQILRDIILNTKESDNHIPKCPALNVLGK